MVQNLVVYGLVALATARLIWTFGARQWLKHRRAPLKAKACGPDCNCST